MTESHINFFPFTISNVMPILSKLLKRYKLVILLFMCFTGKHETVNVNKIGDNLEEVPSDLGSDTTALYLS